MLIPFTKAHGTGNNFIIIYLPECPKFNLNDLLIQKLCNHNIGIGADGLITLKKHQEYNYKMDYYNNDGTWETMCVNGARCVGMLLKEKKIINSETTLIAGDGVHKLKVLNDKKVSLTIFPPRYISDEINIENVSGFSIDSGAKHFVVEIDKDQIFNWKQLGKTIRYSKQFPNGTNVNFVKQIDENTLEVITYEKGVEKIMQSCGSGSVAAAYHMQKKYDLNYDLNINVLGGNLSINTDSEWKKVWLTGKATILFNSKIDINNL